MSTFTVDGCVYSVTSEEFKEVSLVEISSSPAEKNLVINEVDYKGVTYAVTKIENRDGSYGNNYGITNIVIGDNVEIVGNFGLAGLTSVKKLTIGKNVVDLGLKCFAGLKIESVFIPKSVKNIYGQIFPYCKNLKEIALEDGIIDYEIINESLVDTTDNALLSYPMGSSTTEYIVPDDVELIVDDAFNGAINLLKVNTGRNVKKIGDYAFTNNNKLKVVILEYKVETVGLNAFANTFIETFYVLNEIAIEPSTLEQANIDENKTLTNAYCHNPESKFTIFEKLNVENILYFAYIEELGGVKILALTTSATIFIPNIVVKTINDPKYEVEYGYLLYNTDNFTLIDMGTIKTSKDRNELKDISFEVENLMPNTSYTILVNTKLFAPGEEGLEIVEGVEEKFTTKGITSNICFERNTPITTDQGIFPISRIDSKMHTIDGKKIIAITKTRVTDKYAVCICKNSFGLNKPTKDTIVTNEHLINYKNKVYRADYFINKNDGVYKHPIKENEIFYNILMEKHEFIKVNNLNMETLHPNNFVAKLYKNGEINNLDKNNLNLLIDATNFKMRTKKSEKITNKK